MTIQTTISGQLPDNQSENITPAILRGVLNSMVTDYTAVAAGIIPGLGTTGSGAVVLTNAPTLTNPSFTGQFTFYSDLSVNVNNTVTFATGTGPQGQGGNISFVRQNGTTASPSPIVSGDEIAFIQILGWDGAGFASAYPLAVNVVATENWNPTSHGGGVGFQGNANGQVTGQFEGIFANGLILGQGAVQGIGWGTLSAYNAAGTAGPTILAKTAMTSYAAGNWGFGAVYAWANNNYIVPYSDANSRAGIAGSGTFAGGAAGKRIVGIYGDVPAGGHGPSAVCGEFYRPDSSFMVLVGGGFDGSDSVWAIKQCNLSGTALFTVDASGNVATAGKIRHASFTVASLPAGLTGDTVWCSNCRVFNGAGVQEGAGSGTGGYVTYNGSAWKIAGTNITAVA